MAFTKPTGEQISFRSATTGTHTLDTYLEACEKGGFTDVGWFDTNQKFFNQRGIYASGTNYSRLDMVQLGAKVYICITAHTSASSLDETKWVLFFDGAAILAEIQDFKTSSEPRLDLLEEAVLLDIDVL